MGRRASNLLYGASLFALPLVGVGVLRLVTGRDWGGGLQPAWLLMLLGLICAAGRIGPDAGRRFAARLNREPVLRRAGIWAGFMALTVAVSVLGLWVAPATEPLAVTAGRFAKQVVQLGIMAVFAIWPAVWTRGPERWRLTARLVVAGALLQVVYGGLQGVCFTGQCRWFAALERVAASNPAILSGSKQLYLGDAMTQIPRLRGTMCEPLYLGNFLLLALPLVLLTGWRPAFKVLTGVGLSLVLVLTWSRGAWLAAMAGLVLGLFLLGRTRSGQVCRRPSRRCLLWAAGALLAATLAAFLVPGLDWTLPVRRLGQSFSRHDWSNLTRIYSMQAAWRAFLLSPVVGVGWGQFGWHFPVLVDPLGLQSQFTWPVVNNLPLKVLCETGLLGFGVMMAGIGGLAQAVGRSVARNPVPVVASATAAAAVWVQMLTFSQYNLPHIWVALGLLVAALAETPRPGAEP